MLTRRFALFGLPIFILTAVLLLGAYYYVVSLNLRTSVEDGSVSIAQIFANTLWWDYQPLIELGPRMGADTVRADPLTAAFDRDVRALTAGTKIVKIKVYAPNGFIVYSTDPQQIGADYSDRPNFLAARGGGVASSLSHRERLSAVDGPRTDVTVLESYVPVRSPSDPERIVAVLAIYTDVTRLETNILGRPEVQGAIGGLGVVLLLAFGAQLWVLRHAERRFVQEHAARLKVSADFAVAHEASRAKSAFLANMSHELRTPLNAIIGFSEVLKSEMFGAIQPRRYVDYASDIHGAGCHLLDVIDDVLDLAKVEAGKIDLHWSEIDPNALVASALDMLDRDILHHRIGIRRELAAALPPVRTDEAKLRQIVLNIVSNAVKYAGPGGSVVVGTALEDDGSSVLITMSDTGVGMSEAELAVALTPFGRVDAGIKERPGGTGLGLPLAKKLAELLGGRFHIESAPGIGTAVAISLPTSPAEA